MNIENFVNEFLGSQHGQDAVAKLASQGISLADAQTQLTHAATAAGEHVEQHGAGLLGDHPAKSFFAAFAGGLLKGDGLFASLGDGFEGVLSAKVTEAIAERCGLDGSTASTIAAAATPYLASFIKSKFG